MQKIDKIFIAVLIPLLAIPIISAADAQSLNPTGVQFNTSQTIAIFAIGISSGFIRAAIGYDKAKEDFDLIKFFQSVKYYSLAAIPVAFTATANEIMTGNELNVFGYVMIFFGVAGFGEFAKSLRKPTVLSNEAVPQSSLPPPGSQVPSSQLKSTFRPEDHDEELRNFERQILEVKDNALFPEQVKKQLEVAAMVRLINDMDDKLTPTEQAEMIRLLPGLTAREMEEIIEMHYHKADGIKLADSIRAIISAHRAVDRTTKDQNKPR